MKVVDNIKVLLIYLLKTFNKLSLTGGISNGEHPKFNR